jgi:hypothetical protein
MTNSSALPLLHFSLVALTVWIATLPKRDEPLVERSLEAERAGPAAHGYRSWHGDPRSSDPTTGT